MQWNEYEWRMFARALHETNPKAGLLYSPTLSMLDQSMLDRAVKLMPEGRQRAVKGPQKVRAILLDIYSKAIASNDTLFFPNGVATLSTMPVSPTVIEKKPKKKRRPYTRVVWTKDEWVQVAAEIHRLNPLKNYAEADSLRGIKPDEVRWAQRVLPENRRRNGNLNLLQKSSQEGLRTAFDTLREIRRMQAKDDARAYLAAQTPQAAQEPPAPAPQVAPAVSAAFSAALAAPTAAVGGNPWEAAFKPLVGLLAGAILDQATERLQNGTLGAPLLTLLQQALGAAPVAAAPAPAPAAAPAPKPAAVAAPVAAPAIFVPPPEPPKPLTEQQKHAMAAASSALAALDIAPAPAAAPVVSQPVFNGHKAMAQPAAQPKRRIGIWGGQGVIWLDDMHRKYPMFDITYIDNSKFLERLQRCEKIILMTNMVPAAARHKAKKILQGRVAYINGTRSEVYGLLDAYISEPTKKN